MDYANISTHTFHKVEQKSLHCLTALLRHRKASNSMVRVGGFQAEGVSLMNSTWLHYTLLNEIQRISYLVVVCHRPPSPHLSDHEIPQVTRRLQVGLKHLLPQTALDLQRRDPQQQERRKGDVHLLTETRGKGGYLVSWTTECIQLKCEERIIRYVIVIMADFSFEQSQTLKAIHCSHTNVPFHIIHYGVSFQKLHSTKIIFHPLPILVKYYFKTTKLLENSSLNSTTTSA